MEDQISMENENILAMKSKESATVCDDMESVTPTPSKSHRTGSQLFEENQRKTKDDIKRMLDENYKKPVDERNKAWEKTAACVAHQKLQNDQVKLQIQTAAANASEDDRLAILKMKR